MKYARSVVTILGLCLCSCTSLEEETAFEGKWMPGMNLGNVSFSTSDGGDQTSATISPSISYFVADQLAIGGSAFFDRTKYSGAGDSSYLGFGANARFLFRNPREGGEVFPFADVFGGFDYLNNNNVPGRGKDDGAILGASLGLMVPMSDWFFLEPRINYSHRMGSGDLTYKDLDLLDLSVVFSVVF
jgi:hypothetical protein